MILMTHNIAMPNPPKQNHYSTMAGEESFDPSLVQNDDESKHWYSGIVEGAESALNWVGDEISGA